jgi:steroid delta-isomerase-like uncharacterized protein
MGAMSIEANKGVVRAFIEIWNSGDLDQPEDLMADECALTVSGETISCGPSAATRAIATRWRAAFLDYRFDLLDLIAEGDKVVARMPWAGVQRGPIMDIPATGKAVCVGEVVIFRIVGGKIIAAWEEYDEFSLRRQLGVFEAPIR